MLASSRSPQIVGSDAHGAKRHELQEDDPDEFRRLDRVEGDEQQEENKDSQCDPGHSNLAANGDTKTP